MRHALLLLLFLGLATSPARAATYHVATDGNDANDCTQAQSPDTPKLTLNNAVGCLTPGDTLLIRAGTYAEALFDVIPGGTASDRVTVKAFPGETVTLRPASGARVLDFTGSESSFITIDGLILDGVNVTSDAVKFETGASNIIIQHCEITNAPNQGILLSGGGNHQIRDNVIHSNGVDSLTHGIYATTANNLIVGNEVHSNAGYGIHAYDAGAGTLLNVTIRGNLVYSNGTAASNVGGILVGGDGALVTNNISHSDPNVGIRLQFSNVQNAQVYHNTVWNNGTLAGIYLAGSGHDVRNNISFGNTGPAIDDQSTGSTVSSNHTTDPLFVNAAGGDFHLQSGSTAIDGGVTIAAVTDDFDGVSRPQGAAYDIGAYEFTGCSGSSPAWTALSASRTDVGNCVDAASAGDTITIPAGSATWTTELNITKCLHLIGAGEASTILTDNVTKPDQLIDLTCNEPGVFEMTGFKVVGQATDPTDFEQGHLRLGGTAKQFRVHHVTFDQPTTRVVWIDSGHLYGLFDNITGTGFTFQQFLLVSHDDWDGHEHGDGSWADPLAWGTDQAIYIEDSTFTSNTTDQLGLVDCEGGGRYVSRHNTTTNMAFASSHGTDSGQRTRGCRSLEAYENDTTFTGMSRDFASQCRGGTCTIYNNRVVASGLSPGINNMVKAVNFRDTQAFAPWGQCDGTGDYDQNTAGETGWLCIDQPGAGTSDLLSGDPPTPVAWPNQAQDPLYIWGNTLDTGGGAVSNNSVGGSTHVQAGRDYVNDGTQRPGYTAFTYPHPLQAGFGEPAPAATAGLRGTLAGGSFP